MHMIGTIAIFTGYQDRREFTLPVLQPGDRLLIVDHLGDGAYRCVRVDEEHRLIDDETDMLLDEELHPLPLPPIALRHFHHLRVG